MNHERNCDICCEGDKNMIRMRCHHEMCLDCFFKMTKDQCPFCRHPLDSQLQGMRQLLVSSIELLRLFRETANPSSTSIR